MTAGGDGFDVVTGAFSYSESAIARDLMESGRSVRTLTGHPQRAHKDSIIDVRPLGPGAGPSTIPSPLARKASSW